MPVLSNPKWERFAQELAKGKSQTEAYTLAGYKGDRTTASRLATKGNIIARVVELQERSAARAEITVEKLRDMFFEDRQLARDNCQAAAAVSATDKLARLYGHMIDRKEIGKPGDFERMDEDELDAFIAGGQDIAGAGNRGEAAADRQKGMRGKSSGLH